MQNTDLLIRTKLHLPFTQPGLVSRPRLQEQIKHGLCGPLTLITAPAGFGKTTLVATSIAGCGMPMAWLSLDKDDNQVERFLNYLIAALQYADNSIGNEAAQLITGTSQAPSEAVLISLINDLDRGTGEVALVLDDYQFIKNPAVHAAVAFFLEHCPTAFHLLIATRSDPPWPLARLRARNQVVELRADDLRFTGVEAAQFLNEVMGLHLETGSVTALELRTEGWIAGLQMAALSMRTHEDIGAFIAGFSGTNRYILDYLLEEVLTSQAPEIQRFLMLTSILDRLTAPLCEAVMANDEGVVTQSEDRATGSKSLSIGRSNSILEFLERADLFLLPLDDERIWYRYHQLFSDLLRARLMESQPELIPQLHLRASMWFEQNGSILEAIRHSLSVGDHERSAGLILKYGPGRWSQNEPSIMRLMGNLPPELLVKYPTLGIYQAWILISSGQTPAAIALLSTMKEHIQEDDPSSSDAWMRAFIDLLFAYVAHPGEGIGPGSLPDLQVFHSMPEEDAGLHNIADFIYAILLGRRGELEEPAEILLQCVQRDSAAGGTTAVPLAVPLLARIRFMQGRLHEAANLCRETLKPINKKGTKFFYMAGSLHISLGEILREWNELDEAEAQIREGIRVNEHWQMIAADALGYAALARVQEAQGNIAGANATLIKLEAMFEEHTKPPDWEGELRSLQVRLWLATGDLARAVDWVKHFPMQPSPNPLQETDRLTAARVWVAGKNYLEAQHILEALNQTPGIEKRTNRKIKINLLMACAMAGQNQMPQAFQWLETSLSQAEPEGLIRVFLDLGQPMRSLLAEWLAHARVGPLRDHAIHLLGQFDHKPNAVTAAQEKVSSPDGLIEPLSSRELEVLHLMALGRTNQEIAGQLIVARGTIKAHTANIYRKLDVTNRTEAVARARQLGLLP
jgi:LuxR family transcriptional regulator, maltose regulon positive regulatory protein